MLRSSKKHLRSRRHLHSAFWSHGAGNIDLPPWWMLFLQNIDSSQGNCSSTRHRSPNAALSCGLQEILLDFLYPAHTLAFIKRLKQSTNAHIHAAQNVKQCSRSYTSIAANFLKGAKAFGTASGASGQDASTTSSSETPQAGDTVGRRINEILNLEDPTWTYDELWQSYQALLKMSQSLSPEELIKMLRRLGTSERTIDFERAVALFDSIPVQERRAIHYSYAVRAALSLKDLDTAIDIHREGFARVGGSIGTAALLRYTVEHERWQLAIDAWHAYWVDRLRYYTRLDIWTGVNSLSLPDLIEKAISAADFAISTAESSQLESAAAARNFAAELIRQTFSIQKTNFDLEQHWRLVQKARVLDASDMKIQTMALEQLLSVETRKHGHRALHLYRILRKESTFLPSKGLLSSVKNKLLEIKSSPGMFMIIEDYRTYYQELPVSTALQVAEVFAQLGQLDYVQNLFHDVCSTYGKPQNAWFQILLFVHNRRADFEGVVRAFHDLQKDFQFIPTSKAYNCVIGTFSRVDDVDGALTWFNKLLESERRPDSRTYSLLMSMYAKRGDWETVHDFYQQSKIDGIKTSMRMFDTLVLANIKDERLHEAEQFVKEASLVDLEGSRTFMWTILLNAYALRKEVEKVSGLHKQMRDSGVASDGMTYAALMTSLAVAKMPEAAQKILDTVMPRAHIRRTSLHYAIVMGAYLATKEYGKVFDLYKRMLTRNLKPTMSTQNVLLRAAASVDKVDQDLEANQGLDQNVNIQPELVRAQQVFEQTLAGLDPMELAPSEPRKFVGPYPLNEAFSSTYFEYLIFLYGKDAAYAKVTELYESYISTSSRFTGRDVEASPPIRLLSSLMVAHLSAGNHEEVERCWYLALDKSKQLACRARAVTTEPGWVLPSRRFIMNIPLRSYIFSLSQQGRNDDLISTIRSLHSSGFSLNSPNWNHYIQHLAQSPEPKHQLLAFELCERELIPSWPGWNIFGDPQYIRNKIRRLTESALRLPGRRTPAYPTLVHLAAVYLQAKQGTRLIKPRRLADVAPKTVDAIINMPKMADKHQITLLRGG